MCMGVMEERCDIFSRGGGWSCKMCAWVLWRRDVIYLVGEEVRVARCVHGVLTKRGVKYLVGGGVG